MLLGVQMLLLLGFVGLQGGSVAAAELHQGGFLSLQRNMHVPAAEIPFRQERHQHFLRQFAEAAHHLGHEDAQELLRGLLDAAAEFHIEGLDDAAAFHSHEVAESVAALLHHREDVELVDAGAYYQALGVVPLEQLDSLLVDVGVFEAQLGRRLLHRLLVLPDYLGHSALQDRSDGLDLPAVLLLRDLPDAGRGAFAEMGVEAFLELAGGDGFRGEGQLAVAQLVEGAE